MGGRGNHHTIFGAKLFRQHLVAIGVCQSAAALQHLEPSLVADFKRSALPSASYVQLSTLPSGQ